MSGMPLYRAAGLVGCVSLALMVAANAAGTTPAATEADYARAERFLSWNEQHYLLNADPQPRWIGHQDRFWYERTSAVGAKEHVVVDARTGKRTVVAQAGRVALESAPVDPSISPSGEWQVLVRDHNIWMRASAGGSQFPLTSDGIQHYGYAGFTGDSTHAVTDRRNAAPVRPVVLWSPDSRFLLTHRIDERAVGELHLLQSVPEDGSARPRLHTYRYAMPGDEHLPLVELVAVDLRTKQQVTLASGPLVGSIMTLLERGEAWWSADSQAIYYLQRNRYSTSLILYKADPLTGKVREILQERAATPLRTSNEGSIFAERPSVRVLTNGDVIWYSQRDGWGHLYYYDGVTGELRHPITHGPWLVRSVVRVDESGQRIYFMASGRESARDPYEQYLYSVRFDGSQLRLLTPEAANHAWPHVSSGRFSPSGRYFLDSYSRPELPPVFVLRTAQGRLIERLEQADISKLRVDGHQPIEPFVTTAADGVTPIYGNLFRPSTFDAARRYPVIDAIYPGPQAIRTRKDFTTATFDELEAQSLAELGFVVVTIDGRGTPFRSQAFANHAQGRLADASDIEDHIAGIRELAQRYPFMDLQRVGIDGVSAGGYAAVRALLNRADFFKVAVAAEGPHDARGYVAAWGEIYLGPMAEHYAAAANAPLARRLQGKLFLMHGELDDNVHPAATLRLVDALVAANEDFDLLVLPNANHRAWQTPYFIRRKWDFFVRHLQGSTPPQGYSIRRPD
jgi:dipeptidyl-peptidase-4